jgi:nitrite reductase/ring-hydroxylating ferredoxin subunit
MADEQKTPSGPDLAQGVAIEDFVDGKLLGHVGDEEVLLVRRGDEIFAVGAHCTHYHGPLAEGLVAGESVRCPWHHACFDLRTGEALAAPALSPIACWPVEQRDAKIWVSEKRFQKRSAWRSRQWFPQGSAGAAINKEWPGLSPRLESGSGWRTLQSLEGNQIESEKAH